jgi:hypothetical protein
MSKTPYPIILTGLLLIGSSLACNPSFTQVPQPETETPVPAASPTETATLVLTPTEIVAPDTATPEFAPFCEPGIADNPTPSQCQLPIAEQSSLFCTNKRPYNLIFINAGATYELLSEGFECSDAGMKDGRQMITCTGPMASSSKLRVCDPACAIPTVQAEITQCPEGFNYNNLQGCCTQEPQLIDQNCVSLNLGTRSCVVDCGEFTKKAACEKNSYACEWDASNKVCQLRN